MNNTQSDQNDLTVDIRPGDGFPEWIKSDSDYNRYVSDQVAKQQNWLDKVIRNPEMIEDIDPLNNPMGSLFPQESDQSEVTDQQSIKPDPIVTKIAPGEYQLTLANELIYSISKVTEGANKGSWAVSGINNNFRDLFNTKKSCIEFFRAKNNNCW